MIRIERLPPDHVDKALTLVRDVFFDEQKIPVALHNLNEDLKPVWWCARNNSDIVGVVAGWVEDDLWHWGRFAVEKRLRGLGIGKKLAIFSLYGIFNLGADKVHIDARDITVGLLKQIGGKVVCEPVTFYGDPVTPMTLCKEDFLPCLNEFSNFSDPFVDLAGH